LVFEPQPDTFVSTEVSCQSGEVATGWAFRGDSDPSFFGSLRHALPVPDSPGSVPTGFRIVWRSGTQNGSFEALVLCAQGS
jgi:hypothetical protein